MEKKNNKKSDKTKLDKSKIIQTLSSCVDFGNPEEFYEDLLKLRTNLHNDEEKLFLFQCIEAFSNYDRFLIIDAIKNKDRCVCELEVILNKTQPSVSHHLKILEDIKIIKGWKKGKFTHYSIIKPTIKRFLALWNDWTSNISNWFGDIV